MVEKKTVFIVAAGMIVLGLAIGTRLTFGLFLQPMTQAMDWSRGTFALAIAIQNLVWGLTQPFFGMIADRYGSGRVVALGGLGYGAGLYLMSQAGSPVGLHLTAGLLIGISLSATSFAVVLGAVGRAVREERRSLALGIASAGGSVGQLVLLPAGHFLMVSQGWIPALMGLGAIVTLMVPLAIFLSGAPQPGRDKTESQGMREALTEAASHRGFRLLNGGFFVCGFHITFIGTHLPAYIVDQNLPPGLGATALALVGLFNVLGSAFWGFAGGRYSKRASLSTLYMIRVAVIAAFVLFPISETSVLLFSAGMGFLWLGTVPLTSGLVGQIFGVRYLSTLFGIVFLSHQLGAFLGVWLGGYLFDLSGSYLPVWYIAIGLGVVAALLHWPIDERPLERRTAAVLADPAAEA